MQSIEPLLHPVAISQVMINFAASLGVDKDTCLLGTGILEKELLDGEALITREQEMRLIDDQCRQQLQRRQATGLAGQVRQQILGALGLVATLDEVAAAIAVSPRTLRRKLEREGKSFRELVDEERCQLACHLLTGTQMKLDEMAIHLGYTDTASFTRAFRRWKNCAPGEYRKQCLPE